MEIQHCLGCWGCWVRTPGECVIEDDSADVARAVINADFALFASPLSMGFLSATLKRTMDKLIPLVHPYLAEDQGEVHHLARYEAYPLAGLLLAKGDDTDDQDVQIVSDIFSRTMLNFKSQRAFTKLIDDPVDAVADAIVSAERQPDWAPPRSPTAAIPGLHPYEGPAPTRLTVFNGSPRGKAGNTELMLAEFIRGFVTAGGRCDETVHLIRSDNRESLRQRFAEAESVLLGFPLYTDAMPGVVKALIEALAPLVGRKDNPPLGFLVQSGFPEAAHSRYVERYLQKLTVRLGSPYIGTIVKGGGEGTRQRPPKANQALFDTLHQLGEGFGRTGRLNPTLLQELAKPERFPKIAVPILKLMAKTPIAQLWWNQQLKANDAYAQRFARPYGE
jgi:multimeric flavodoxin WrbA